MNKRITRTQPRQPPIDRQPLPVTTAPGVVVAKELQRLNVIAIALYNALQEIDLNVQITFLL
jgi:hypothetical protein